MTAEHPSHLRVTARGLSHHLLEWSSHVGSSDGGENISRVPGLDLGTAVLLHGYMDAAATWDLVAPHLAAAGLRVLALDMRGHGDGPRTPPGSYYHFPEYVADLAEVLEALGIGEDLFLVGHSMGGTIATYYAGAFPERVRKLALLEGLGPEDNPHDVVPDRMRAWIDSIRAIATRGERAPLTRPEAMKRLARQHPNVAASILETRLDRLTRDAGDGRVVWKWDPLHKTPSPNPFFAKGYVAFARRIPCPVLSVGGGPSGYHPRDEASRSSAFAHLTEREIAGAGHMMHWTEPRLLAETLVQFWTHH
jgi:pimeloyl-ACP methyl ester carboxylesterase